MIDVEDERESLRRREEALIRASLPPRLAPLLKDTDDSLQLALDARDLGRELRIQPEPPEAIALARKAIAHAEQVRRIHGED